MPVDQLLESLLDAGAQIDSAWSMFVVVHLGLFWFFFLMQRPLLMMERLIALVAYGIFAYINGNALIGSYELLEALRVDLLANLAQANNVPALKDTIGAANYAARHEMIFATHGGGMFFVTLILIFRNSMIAYYKKHYPEYLLTPSKVGLD